MIAQALEFCRLANPQPQHTEIEKRSGAAEALAAKLVGVEARSHLLAAVQGVVSGFDKTPFTQQSPTVKLIVETIKLDDLSLPEDLTENSNSLRAVAAMAIQSILKGKVSVSSTIVALALRSALSLRKPPTERYLKWVLEALLASAHTLLVAEGEKRRDSTQEKLSELLSLEAPDDEDTDLWGTLLPAVQSAVRELSVRAEIDREEVNMLWWMFTAFSSIAGKPLDQLRPEDVASCVGLELAELSLLPPTPNSTELVKRTIVRTLTTTTEDISLKSLSGAWSSEMRGQIVGPLFSGGNIADKIPAVLPLSRAVSITNESETKVSLDKAYVQATGFAPTLAVQPDEWGAQIFRETVLKRFLVDQEEK